MDAAEKEVYFTYQDYLIPECEIDLTEVFPPKEEDAAKKTVMNEEKS